MNAFGFFFVQAVTLQRRAWWTGINGNKYDLFAILFFLSPLLFFGSVIVTWRSRHSVDELICSEAEILAYHCQSYDDWQVTLINYPWWTTFFFVGLQWTYINNRFRTEIYSLGERFTSWNAKAWGVFFAFIIVYLGILA